MICGRQLRFPGLLFLPELTMAVLFGLAWSSAGASGIASLADCRQAMMLEGLFIVAAMLVGVRYEVAVGCLPLIVIACVVYVVSYAGGLSWVICGFLWFVITAFVDGLRAHRGRFGTVAENPDHPERRLDRRFVLYLGTVPLWAALLVLRHPSRWAIWGAVYFGLLFLADTVLRTPFDRGKRALWKRVGRRISLTPGEAQAQMGICYECVYRSPAIPVKPPERLIRCQRAATDPSLPEHPVAPVKTCAGFRKEHA